jgi:hypothetical protein
MPPTVKSAVGTIAVARVDDMYVVFRLDPFQVTVTPCWKFVPLTVRINPGLSIKIVVGLIDVIVGAGSITSKESTLLVPPPGAGVTTVTAAGPLTDRSLAGTVAVSDVGEL